MGALNLTGKITDTSQTIRNARFLFSQPVVIRNAHVVNIAEERVFPKTPGGVTIFILSQH